MVAHLTRALGLGHWALAEDAVQFASLRALERWPQSGTPDNPGAWLYRVAHHHAIDMLRGAGRHVPWPEDDEAGDWPITAEPAPQGRLQGELDDDELALLFAACHPRLPATTQVALALRALCGLELATLADSLFTTEAALAQRLARARQSLAGETLGLPAGHELAARREAVLTTLLLIFHHGQQAAGRHGDSPAEAAEAVAGPASMCWEAIRLARALAAHPATADADADALAALLLLHGARLSGRIDAQGEIVLLPGQPRDRWDAGLIRLGLAHLQAAQSATRLSRWHVLAGIAAEHATAPDYDRTNWPTIVRAYELLMQLDASAAPALGHAIALSEAGSPKAALDLLQGLAPKVPLALRAHTLAAMASAQQRLGEVDAALQCLDEAIGHARHPADARLLARRRASMAALQAGEDLRP